MARESRKSRKSTDDAANLANDAGDNGNADGATVILDTAASPGPVTVDPASVTASADTGPDEPVRRKRGRPPGSGGIKAKAIPINVNGLEKLLIGVHTSLAFLTGRAEFLLDTSDKTAFDGRTEAEFLSKSITDVSDHYKVEWLDQKSIDWANLIQCLMIVYGGRLFAIRSAPRNRAAPAAPPPAVRPGPPASVHRDTPTTAGVSEAALRTGQVAGVGEVEFPADHPLMGGGKPN